MPQQHDVFISYHWRDRERVERLARWLVDEAHLFPFLDRWYLVPGQPWPQALEQAMFGCRAAALCVGPGELGHWQVREMNLALARQEREPDFPVIPVLLPGADPVLGFLAQNTWIDLRDVPNESTLLEVLAAAIRRQPPGAEPRGALSHTRAHVCPFRGLLYFREEDASFFYGREVATQYLISAVARSTLTAVVGASGSGKSSVVRAGLVPALRRGRDTVWEISTIVPGVRPLRALAASFVPLLEPDIGEVDLLLQIDALSRAFIDGHTTIRDVIERVLVKQRGTDRLLLVVDQWEELYTLAQEGQAWQRFVDLLLDASCDSLLSVVLTLRGDFVGDAMAYRPLADAMQDAQVNLGPMTREELRRAIEAPGDRVGLQFESGLTERILDDVAQEPGNLPLLEFVLKRLWEMRKGPLLLHDAYEHIGKLEGAVASKAESVYTAFSEREQVAVQRVFLQLARPVEGRDFTSRRATADELPPSSLAVIKKLADERLVVTGRIGDFSETTIELAHEALITHWTRLREWLDRDREFLLWRQRLRLLIQDWLRAGEPDDMLLRRSLLTEAERWCAERADQLTDDEKQYISLSGDLHRRQLQEQRQQAEQELARVRALADAQSEIADERGRRLSDERRANRKLRYALAALAIVATGLLAAAAWGAYQASVARRNLAAGYLREGVSVLDDLPDEAVPFIAAAIRLQPNNVAARAAAFDGLLTATWPLVSFQHGAGIYAAALSSDGSRVVTASYDNSAQVWDARTGKPIGPPLRHGDQVGSAAFTVDGSLVITGSRDKTARVWDTRTGQAVFPPLQHLGDVYSASFSLDGAKIITASADKTAQIWDARTGRSLVAPLQHADAVVSAIFNESGSRVLTASEDHTARVWDANSGEPIGRPLRHKAPVRSGAFSRDGQRVVTASDDGTAQVWDARTGQPVIAPLQHEARVWSAAFSPTGDRVVTASADGMACVWDVRTGQRVTEPMAHRGEVMSAMFSFDGNHIVTASTDRTARIWNARTGHPEGAPLHHRRTVRTAVFSSDGSRVLTASEDSSARLWDVRPGLAVGMLLQHDAPVNRAAFSRDGFHIVTASDDKTSRVWDARTGRTTAGPLSHGDIIISASFSYDGTRVVTASADHTARVWDARNGSPVTPPLQHDDEVLVAAFNPDGSRVITASADKTARVWDARTGQSTMAPFYHTAPVVGADFSPDGHHALTASLEGTAQIWDVQTGKPVITALQHGGQVFSATFSSDGSRVVTASGDNTARVWDAQTGHPLGVPLRHDGVVLSAAFSPNGRRIVTSSGDGTARVWNAMTGEPVGVPLMHARAVRKAVFSPDGMRVLTASMDNTSKVWDAQTGQLLSVLRHDAEVWSAVFSPDGTRVVSASDDGMARIWDVPTGAASDAATIVQAAEALTGYTVSDMGGVIRLDNRGDRVASLREAVGNAQSGIPTAASILHWFFQDPWHRTISPLSTVTVDEYILERLKRCKDGARSEVEFYFPSHPLLLQIDDFCSGHKDRAGNRSHSMPN